MRILALGLLMACLTPQSAEKPKPPPGMVELDGERHPEKIPDHWVWRTSFLFLTELARSQSEKDLRALLSLNQDDTRILYQEAKQQDTRDGECRGKTAIRHKELLDQKNTREAVRREMQAIMIDCNARVLDAADRVLDALSEEGRAACLAWIERRRRTMKLMVPEDDLNVYALPR